MAIPVKESQDCDQKKNVDETEVKLAKAPKKVKLAGNEFNFPPSLFYTLSKRGCLVVDKKKTYVPVVDAKPGTDCLFVGNRTYGLKQEETVPGLLKLHRVLDQDQIKSWCDSYVESLVARTDVVKDLTEKIQDNLVLDFVVNQVFKHYTGVADEHIGELVGAKGEVQIGELETCEDSEIIDEIIDQLIRGVKSEVGFTQQDRFDELLGVKQRKPGIKAETEELSDTLSDLLGFEKAIFLNGQVYTILQDKKYSNPGLVIGGIRYTFVHHCSIEEFEGRYQDRLSEILKIEAIKSGVDKFKKLKGLHKRKLAKEIFENGEYKLPSGVGVKKYADQWYLTYDIPQFVVRDEMRNKYFLFQPSKVGVRIYSSKGRIQIKRPCHINASETRDQFDHGWCMGQYNFDKTFRTDLEKAITFLEDAKRILMTGFGHKDTPWDHFHIPRNCDYKEITKQEMDGLGLYPTNLMAKK